MKGLNKNTEKIFEQITKLESINGYVLIGGTALSLQINHRLSEDLDFCKWKKSKNEKLYVDWNNIEKELNTIVTVNQKDIIDSNQCNFLVDGVKLSFYANNTSKQPKDLQVIHLKNNLYVADIKSIGIMKIEVMLRRSTFRDYYDLYSILKEGISFSELIDGALNYSGHNLKTKDVLAMLTNGSHFVTDTSFQTLSPKYDINIYGIAEYIGQEIVKYNEIKKK